MLLKTLNNQLKDEKLIETQVHLFFATLILTMALPQLSEEDQ